MKTVLRAFACCGLGLASFSSVAQKPESLVMISIDGMKPEYVTHADEHHLKIPTLRSFLKEGAYAEGVVGVVPTVTYPSHTTMVTGVWPAEHGVADNTTFDPLNQHPGQWYWDFSWIKVPTLYTAADAAGIRTAAVGWPVTVGAPIDYLLAEGAQSERTDKPSGPAYVPADIVAQLAVPPVNKADGRDEDDVKTDQAVVLEKRWKPGFMLVHITNLDHQEHLHEPFSAEANAMLEHIDGQVKQIIDGARAANPRTRIVIVSDHGFLPVQQRINLNVLFAQEGLIKLGPIAKQKTKQTVLSWDAEAWSAGGSAAIMLRDPNDAALVARVKALLEKWKADPRYRIADLLTHDDLQKAGGFPQASFLVDFQEQADFGGDFIGDVVSPAPHTGMHGYLPSRPAMRSTFMVEGDGIAKGKDLGVIDMRQIAPTVAELIGVNLPTATMGPVDVRK